MNKMTNINIGSQLHEIYQCHDIFFWQLFCIHSMFFRLWTVLFGTYSVQHLVKKIVKIISKKIQFKLKKRTF